MSVYQHERWKIKNTGSNFRIPINAWEQNMTPEIQQEETGSIQHKMLKENTQSQETFQYPYFKSNLMKWLGHEASFWITKLAFQLLWRIETKACWKITGNEPLEKNFRSKQELEWHQVTDCSSVQVQSIRPLQKCSLIDNYYYVLSHSISFWIYQVH